MVIYFGFVDWLCHVQKCSNKTTLTSSACFACPWNWWMVKKSRLQESLEMCSADESCTKCLMFCWKWSKSETLCKVLVSWLVTNQNFPVAMPLYSMHANYMYYLPFDWIFLVVFQVFALSCISSLNFSNYNRKEQRKLTRDDQLHTL